MGLFNDLEYVCFPGCDDIVVDAKYVNKDVVVTKNYISSKAAGTTFDFAYEIIKYLRENHLSNIPIVNDKKKFLGLLSMKDITTELLSWDYNVINTSYTNILNTIQIAQLLMWANTILHLAL